MTGRTAVIAGASGLVGGCCLEYLIESRLYERVISVARHALDVEAPQLTQNVVDFANLPAFESLGDADVFCALGTTIRKAGSQDAFRKVDFEYPLNLAARTREAGATKFLLVSSVGADKQSSNFYLRVKGEVEEAIEQAGFETLHIFRPSILLGKREEFRFGERLGKTAAHVLNILPFDAVRRFRPIAAKDVAQAMVAAAQSSVAGTWIHEWDEIQQLAAL